MPGPVRGFTLVEVLLVFALGSLLIALVAPLGVVQVEKARAQSEWLQLERTLGRLSLDAFMRSDYVTLTAQGTELSWEFTGGRTGSMVFEQLFFSPDQRFTINPNGISDRPSLEVLQRDRPRQIDLLPGEGG